MTDQINTPTIEGLKAEVARLAAHGNDLLAERKSEKARREAAEKALAELKTAHEATTTKLNDVTLNQPVLRVLEDVCRPEPAQSKKLLEMNGFAFRISEHGTPVAEHGGEEIALPDLHKYLSKQCETPDGMRAFGYFVRGSTASGGGATGGTHGVVRVGATSTPKPPPVRLGLR